MSLRAYCQSCGSPTEYSLVPPNFCSQCSKPFRACSGATVQTANTISKAARPTPSVSAANSEDDDDDSHVPTCVPHLDHLEVEFDASQTRGIKIGSIASAAKIEVKNIKVKVPTKKQILADFQKSASAIRKGESSEIS